MRLTAASPSRNSKVPSSYQLASSAQSIPAPVWGWDALNPVAKMKPDHAVKLVNWFPQTSWVELRKGFILHADTGTGVPVESLMAYQGLTSAKLFAASSTSVFDVTTDTVTEDVTGLGNARIQHVNFSNTGGNFLYCVNGADDPFYFDGTSWATATITGVGIDATEWVLPNVFKSRLFFIKNNSTSFDYLPIDTIQGAATSFELGGLMSMGGYLMSMGTWSIDAGDGPDDYAVFVTSRGQVIIYRGSDPDNAPDDWQLVGVFNMGAPIGRRCLTRVGADLAVICIDGVLPLSRAMIYERAAVVKISLTERIQRVMNESARAYKDNFGWQLISYPQGTRAILNVPVAENATQEQYVMNTITGAWCKYTGHNGSCWELLNDNVFFGGNEGLVFQADTNGTDNGEAIEADMMTAFYDYGTPGVVKRWVECQPLITSDSRITPGIAFNVDFQENAPISVPDFVVTQGAEWDLAAWDQSVWPDEVAVQVEWLGASGIGHWMSIRLVAHVFAEGLPDAYWGEGVWGGGLWYTAAPIAPEVTLQLNGFNVVYETGRAFV